MFLFLYTTVKSEILLIHCLKKNANVCVKPQLQQRTAETLQSLYLTGNKYHLSISEEGF